ncbi:MAG: hypothetical protein E1N59_2832 [Puniceicoccaceae bacterium 5H]|nr:MAG: hypothetical protein E1N59_2832 [Puniceicoccaceae bacterium 5H]
MNLITNPDSIADKHPKVPLDRQAQIYNHLAECSDRAAVVRVLEHQLPPAEWAYVQAITQAHGAGAEQLTPKAVGFNVPGKGLVPIPRGTTAAKPSTENSKK